SQVFVPATGMWGYEEANGTWTGVVGMITRGEVEVGVCDVAMTPVRIGVVSYSMQVATFQYVIKPPTLKANAHDCLCSYKIFVRIGDVDVSWDSFLRPLSTGLWVVMAASAVAMALALKICFQVDLGNRKKQRMDTALQDLVFATFGAVFCSQGQPRTPLTFQCRLVYIMPYMLGMLLLCAYSAAVISFLTVHKTNLPFTTLEQLHQDKTYTVRAVRGSSTFETFRVCCQDVNLHTCIEFTTEG
ncbi:hypothetical protein Cfor_02101, partial [Coptotermes formosanus]